MKSKTLPTVTVGIPAYNEEANIENLLRCVLNQNHKNYELLEIIVILDRCTDQTSEKIKLINDHRIIIISNTKRIGQALSQNKIISKMNGDILLLLNADIILANNYIEELIKPILKNNKVGLVSGMILPLSARNQFEKTLNFSVKFKNSLFENHNQGDTPYLCHGRGRAFSGKYLKNFKWPKLVSEDAYAYLRIKEIGLKFKYQKTAKLYFRSPETLTDHVKQSIRFQQSIKELCEYFPKEFVLKNYKISPWLMIANLALYFKKNPLAFLSFAFIFSITTVISFVAGRSKVAWSPSSTSKQLF